MEKVAYLMDYSVNPLWGKRQYERYESGEITQGIVIKDRNTSIADDVEHINILIFLFELDDYGLVKSQKQANWTIEVFSVFRSSKFFVQAES